MTEDELLEGVAQALALRARWDESVVWWHIRRSDLALTMGTPGIPDVMVVLDGRLEAWELKTERGVVTEEQLRWRRALSDAGVIHHIVRPADYDELIERIVGSRLVRRGLRSL